jgi:hypothetical protein
MVDIKFWVHTNDKIILHETLLFYDHLTIFINKKTTQYFQSFIINQSKFYITYRHICQPTLEFHLIIMPLYGKFTNHSRNRSSFKFQEIVQVKITRNSTLKSVFRSASQQTYVQHNCEDRTQMANKQKVD